MNDRTAGAILLVIGVVAIFAAIVGGGVKIQQIEVGSVQSKWRQWLLGAFGLVIGIVGLAMVLPDSAKPADVANADANDSLSPVGNDVAPADGNDTGAADATGDHNNVDESGDDNGDSSDGNAAQ